MFFLHAISGRKFEFQTPYNNFSDRLEVKLKIIRGMTTMCSLAEPARLDTKFVVEGKTILANSHLLAAKSGVFQSSLFGSMQEAKTKEIKITDASYSAVSMFLRFIATDALETSQDVLTLVEVYKLAHLYMIPMIQDETTLHIVSLTTEQNLYEILRAAQECKAQQIISAVLHKASAHEFQPCAEKISHLFLGK
eukprot:Phypoly_transcript_12582.p1 GENE.Phypoly_transcript_12582~~Phypoly_transcript_12582.p1  ORF type:complete len:194 (+),score=24.93 Phypoly_transcript_12582:400-981(+)